MAAGGLLPGAITIVFCGMAAALGLYLLAKCAPRAGHRQSSFFALSQLTLPQAAVIFDAAIAIKCGGVSISYLIIIGTLAPKVVTSFTHPGTIPPDYLLDRRTWILLSMLILVPLAFLRSLNSLRFYLLCGSDRRRRLGHNCRLQVL